MAACANIWQACTPELTLTPSSNFIKQSTSSSSEWVTYYSVDCDVKTSIATNQHRLNTRFSSFLLSSASLAQWATAIIIVAFSPEWCSHPSFFWTAVAIPACSRLQATDSVAYYIDNSLCLSHTLWVQCGVQHGWLVILFTCVHHATTMDVCMCFNSGAICRSYQHGTTIS